MFSITLAYAGIIDYHGHDGYKVVTHHVVPHVAVHHAPVEHHEHYAPHHDYYVSLEHFSGMNL